MEYAIKRSFEHRTHGEIAAAITLKANVTDVTIDGKKLPEKSVEYLLNFALQSLQDAYAGAKNGEEAKGLFNKKLNALIEGSIGQRVGGGQSEETRVAISVTRQILKAKLTAEAYAKYKDSDEEVLATFEKNKAKIQPLVDERLEQLRKEREKKAELMKSAGELDL